MWRKVHEVSSRHSVVLERTTSGKIPGPVSSQVDLPEFMAL